MAVFFALLFHRSSLFSKLDFVNFAHGDPFQFQRHLKCSVNFPPKKRRGRPFGLFHIRLAVTRIALSSIVGTSWAGK